MYLSFHFDYFLADVNSADSVSLSAQRDDHRVRVVVCVADLHVFKDVSMLYALHLFCTLLRLISIIVNLCITLLFHFVSTGG